MDPYWRHFLPAELGGKLRSAEIWLVVGTRPEAIKLSPVASALADRGLDPRLVLTGQHVGLDPAEHELERLRRLDLHCPGLTHPDAHVARVRRSLRRHLASPPALLIVQGDTSSALGAAMAGFDRAVPVAHVEAGLRTGDPGSPWPEEAYRSTIDQRATLLFAPTDSAAANLAGEAVPGAVFVTGNSGIDALRAAERQLPPARLRERARPCLLVTCHRRESWGEGLAGIASALRAIAESGLADIRFVLHPNAHVTATMRRSLGGCRGIELVDPCEHSAMLELMRDADLILSDSGGMQEEAPGLGVPLLVLRDKTERSEGIVSGNARLVGTDPQRIRREVERLLGDPVALATMATRAFPYGDGYAAPRIARLVEDWLEARRLRA
ncbi:MAG: UDP-N-acetylglucosamine 2-epimerase (non-hydrolyzing) [Sphingomicrobium sp.]